MTIHEEHPAPLMNKEGWNKMKQIEVKCDFCEKLIEGQTFFELRTCDSSIALDVCPRCMSILEDEVRKRISKPEQKDTFCHKCGKLIPWEEGKIMNYNTKNTYCSMKCLEEDE